MRRPTVSPVRLYGGHIVRVTEKGRAGGAQHPHPAYRETMVADPSYVGRTNMPTPTTSGRMNARRPTRSRVSDRAYPATARAPRARWRLRPPVQGAIAGDADYRGGPAACDVRRQAGAPPDPRSGASRPPELASRENVTDVVRVTEPKRFPCAGDHGAPQPFIGPSTERR